MLSISKYFFYMQTLHSSCSEPYCVSWQTMILKELARYFGGHWKLLVYPQWEGFILFPFTADTRTWKLLNLPFWIILGTYGRRDCLKKPLIFWGFCTRDHNEHISEVPPAESPAELFSLCPGHSWELSLVPSWSIPTCAGDHWEFLGHPGNWVGTQALLCHPVIQLEQKGLTNSIALAPVGKLFSFATVKHQAQVQSQLLAEVHEYTFAVTEDG